MVIIASLIFTCITILAFSSIALTLSGAMPRIKKVVAAAHGYGEEQPERQITIMVPVAKSAEIISLSRQTKLSSKTALPDYQIAA